MRAGVRNFVLFIALILGLWGCSGTGHALEGTVKNPFTRGQVMVVAATERNRYQNIYGEAFWEATGGDGEGSFEERLKGQIQQFFEEMTVMSLLADEKGLELTSREEDAIRRLATEYWQSLSAQDQAYIGASEEEVYELYAQYYRANRLMAQLTQQENLEVSDAQAKVIEVRKMTFSERTQAEEALALIQGGKSFASVAASLGQDVKNTTVMERSDSPGPVEHMAFSMDTDEVSGIVEENGVYYILQCANGYDEEATQARKEKLVQEKKNAAFQKIYAPFAEKHPVVFEEGLWEAISFTDGAGSSTSDFFERYWEMSI